MPKKKPTTEPTTEIPEKKDRKPHEPFFELLEHDGKWHWCLWSGNGRPMAESSEGYDTKKHCIQAIKLIAPNSKEANLIVKSHVDEEAKAE